MKISRVTVLILAYFWFAGGSAFAEAQTTEARREGFEAVAKLPPGWEVQGGVRVVEDNPFDGKHALALVKTEAALREIVSATGPAFPVGPGILELEYATRADLASMDNSYNGSLSVEFLDAEGASLGVQELGSWFRKSPWQVDRARVEIPEGATSARWVARINKETPGTFWLDELSARTVAPDPSDEGLRRMVFKASRLGHLLLPEDSRVVDVEVWSFKPLPESSARAVFHVRDYWGAEQDKPIEAVLAADGKVPGRDFLKYTAKVDLSKIPLETGRYYELHGAIGRADREPFSNHTSFAILPEAPANAFEPEEIPFTSRTWDQRFPEGPHLTRRLGIRICNVWGRMNPDPAKLEAPLIELVHDLGLGVLTSSPAQGIEARSENWRELLADDGALLRKGVRNFFEKYGDIKPMIVILGNEPHSKGEDVKHDVEAYRILYTEIKRIDPSVYVVGTSVGLQEDYFKAGFGQWCDAYNFHSYEDPDSVREIVEKKYPAMFEKYGFAKPVWSTELGMNSQGMSRLAVASLLYKKFTNFFAGGGANASWFGLFYPDPDAKIHDSFASAHNVFDCRYNQYAPKLDAIAYYNAVNGIGAKKFVADQVYDGDLKVFLFRDQENRTLLVCYKNKGRKDVFLPLPGIGKVERVGIDGRRVSLDAQGKGLSLTFDEDPFLLMYEGGSTALPDRLDSPAVELAPLPTSISRAKAGILEVLLNRATADQVDLIAPPLREVKKSPGKNEAGQEVLRFEVKAPEESDVREADMALTVRRAEGMPSGWLSFRLPVDGLVEATLLPIPAGQKNGPGVLLKLKNNSSQKQKLTWNLVPDSEQSLRDGEFLGPASTRATFSEAASGVAEIAPQASAEISVPLSGVKPVTVYQIKGTVRDGSGKIHPIGRAVAGFVGVPRVDFPLQADGHPEERAWANVPAQTLDQASQFFAFLRPERPIPTWTGPEDLSAQIRFLWDDQFLHVRIGVKDDVAGAIKHQGADLWQQDGLQFLIDPARSSREKPGKYEYCIGEGTAGAQVWCVLSADAGAPAGDAKDIRLAIRRGKSGTGDVTYDVAIPWSRLAPFKPSPGANLGFTLIVNEDDGNGRDSFMTWFGNAHTKDIDTVGDLILLP